MTPQDYAGLSDTAISAAAFAYFLAFLAHIAEWVFGRRLSAGVDRAAVPAAVGAGVTGPLAALPQRPEEPEERGGKVSERFDLAGRIGVSLTVLGMVLHAVSVVARGFAAERAPWGNMYEFTLTASLLVSVIYVGLIRVYALRWLGPVVTGFLLTVLMLDVLLLYLPAGPLTPALQSPWLVIHVAAAIIATGAFTVAGMTSVLFLLRERAELRGRLRPGSYLARVPDLPTLDRLSYRLHAFGFPVWTFGALIAGPIWAQYAWSRYWGWDPKEVWAFITWVVYAAYLHARATAGWKGRRAALVALVGLATLWFNFIGINYFFGQGLHSYAQ